MDAVTRHTKGAKSKYVACRWTQRRLGIGNRFRRRYNLILGELDFCVRRKQFWRSNINWPRAGPPVSLLEPWWAHIFCANSAWCLGLRLIQKTITGLGWRRDISTYTLRGHKLEHDLHDLCNPQACWARPEQYRMSLDAQLGVLSKLASCPRKLGMHCTRLGSSPKIAAVGMHAVPSEVVECNTYSGSLKIYLEYGLE